MPLAEVDICNRALIKVGSPTIVALTDDSKEANTCIEVYESIRDEMIRDRDWNFAIKRVQLSQVSGAPLGDEFDYQYSLPTDPYCLRVMNVLVGDSEKDPQPRYRIEGRLFLTTVDTVKIRYLASITDTTEFDSLFASALAWKIAEDVCLALTQDPMLFSMMQRGSAMAMQRAIVADQREESETPDGEPDLWADEGRGSLKGLNEAHIKRVS